LRIKLDIYKFNPRICDTYIEVFVCIQGQNTTKILLAQSWFFWCIILCVWISRSKFYNL